MAKKYIVVAYPGLAGNCTVVEYDYTLPWNQIRRLVDARYPDQIMDTIQSTEMWHDGIFAVYRSNLDKLPNSKNYFANRYFKDTRKGDILGVCVFAGKTPKLGKIKGLTLAKARKMRTKLIESKNAFAKMLDLPLMNI